MPGWSDSNCFGGIDGVDTSRHLFGLTFNFRDHVPAAVISASGSGEAQKSSFGSPNDHKLRSSALCGSINWRIDSVGVS